MTTGERIRHIRNERGISQKQLNEPEKAGLEITVHDDEPVICVKGDNPQLEKLLKKYAASK